MLLWVMEKLETGGLIGNKEQVSLAGKWRQKKFGGEGVSTAGILKKYTVNLENAFI